MTVSALTALQNAQAAADNAASGTTTTTPSAAAGSSAATGTTGASTTGASTTGASTTGASTTGTNALSSLSGNFQDFLTLLMTQLQNQDPTSPLDTAQFTSQLVQFSSVEQQINTNTSLTQLIQLTQSGELLQSSSMVGHQVSVTSDHLPLQNGNASLTFTAPSAGPVAIAVYNAAGVQLDTASVQAVQGANTWKWNGTDQNGNQVADGSYRVAVYGSDASGNPVAVPFTVTGTATGVTSTATGLNLQLGTQNASFSSITSVASGD